MARGLINGSPEEAQQSTSRRSPGQPGAGGKPGGPGQGAGAGPAQPGMEEGGLPEGAEPMTPEEEEWSDNLDAAVSEMLYSEGGMAEELVGRMQKAPEPHIEAGQIASDLIIGLDEQFEGDIPETVIIPATDAALNRVLDLGSQMGLFEINEQIVGQAKTHAWSEMFDHYGFDEEAMAEAQKDLNPEAVNELSNILGVQAGG